MIEKILFYDGDLGDISKHEYNFSPVKEAFNYIIYDSLQNGFTAALGRVKKLMSNDFAYTLVTNNPFFIHIDFVNSHNIDDIYLYNFIEKGFKPIRSFVNRELRPAHNLSKMWIGGAFPDANNNTFTF